MKVDNAIILAAGTSSRFAPLSYETHKALIKVKGEVLIERQIRQLKEAGIEDIIIVTGYKAESFAYLKEKYNLTLIHNPEYLTRNNHSSIHAVKGHLKNSYICSGDNYFRINPFTKEVDESYYAALFAPGKTAEWCITTDKDDYISKVEIGGENSYYMMGHTFWSQEFSSRFIKILEEIYPLKETKDMLWEDIYIRNLNTLKMKIRRYPKNDIFEFDTLDELRLFDPSYIEDTSSAILKQIAKELHIQEKDIHDIKPLKTNSTKAVGFLFKEGENTYQYTYQDKHLEKQS